MRSEVLYVFCILTQLVPVGQQDGGAVEHMRQRRLDQLPAGDALDGLRQGRRQPVELILHQHPLEGLEGGGGGRREEETSGGELKPLSLPI